MPKILIADPFDAIAKQTFIEACAVKGHSVIYKPILKGETLAEELATGHYDVLIVGSKDIEAPMLQGWRQANPNKPLCIVRSGSDFSHIAIGAAAESGIVVGNTPGANKGVIADYILNRLPQDGKGKTLAVIGYGSIGKDVVKYAQDRGFAVQIYSPHLVQDPVQSFTVAASPREALQNADFVSITTPLITREEAERVNRAAGKKLVTPSFHIIDAQALAGLKEGAHIILPSRPEVIDMTALTEAVRNNNVVQVYVNTTADDIAKLKQQHPMLVAGGKIDIQPSVNFLTLESKYRMAVQACERVFDFLEGRVLKNTIIPVLAAPEKAATIFAHPIQSILEQRRNQVFDESNIQVESLATAHAKVFLTYENESTPEKYAYSGIRVLSPMSDEQAIQNAKRLSLTSSSWKNWLINHAIKDGALDNLSAASRHALPKFVINKREIYGGRVIIVPNTGNYQGESIETILKSPEHPSFTEVSTPIYQVIGTRLNELEGRLKVTPDFGPNASTADKMHDSTPHVLGISEERQGSGGKSEYSITSILTAVRRLGIEHAPKHSPISVIGAAGALGSGVCGYLQKRGFTNVTLCDLQYNDKALPPLPEGWNVAKAVAGRFTEECLGRSGKGSWVITTAYGDEMIHSKWQRMKAGTIWIGAQNKDLPEQQEGIAFARALSNKGITHIPGQILTIGGTAASWVEWRTRQAGMSFSKPAAHEVVAKVSDILMVKMLSGSKATNITPYEAMLDYAHKSHWQEKMHVRDVMHAAKNLLRHSR